MMKYLTMLALSLSLFTFNAHAASDAPLKVVSAEFGLFDFSDPDNPTYEPADTVPLVPGQAFGWVIQLDTDKETVKWREEFTVPAKPATWGDLDETNTMSADGRTLTTVKTDTLNDGAIFNAWEIAPGDPAGKYVMRVFVEGELVSTFEFDVQSPPAEADDSED
jgi:hypothetical protein